MLTEGTAGHDRHAPIGHDDVDGGRRQDSQRRLTIACGFHLESVALAADSPGCQGLGLVVNQPIAPSSYVAPPRAPQPLHLCRDYPIATLAFRVVHAFIGYAQNRIDGVAVAAELRYADADRDRA
jgi:hypothetical protein